MHQGVIDWARATLLPDLVRGRRVLDVGALDVNGSLREYLDELKPDEILGIDLTEGTAVDAVVDVKDLLGTFGPQRWDVILCTEMLEHCYEWQNAIYQMKESLVDGGWLVLTTRAPGYPHHDYPSDHWRFTKEVLMEALEDMEDVQTWSDPGFPDFPNHQHILQAGVFIRAKRNGPVGTPTAQAEPAPSPKPGYVGIDPR